MARDTTTPVPNSLDSVATRYRLDVAALLTNLLPTLLRKPRLLAWLKALLSPAAVLYGTFLQYRTTTLRQLSYNGQTILLEKALNDTYDPIQRRIVVRNAVGRLTPLYLNFVREAQPAPPVYFIDEPDYQPLYLSRQVEFNSQVDFTVYAPGLNARALGLNALVRRLKLAMTNYQILYTPAP